MTSAGTILWDVVGEHLDEAEFLAEQWLAAAQSPRFSLVRLQKTVERRLIAHLDGLVVGGNDVAEQLLWPALGTESDAPAARVAAAGLALLMEGDAAVRDRLIDLLRTAEADAVRDGLRRAFQLTARTDIDDPVRMALYATDVPATQAALLGVLEARRVDPGPILGSLLQSADHEVLVAALRAGGAADPRLHQQLVEPRFSHESPDVRAAAIGTGLIWNSAFAWKTCVAEAKAGLPEAMLFVALLGGLAEFDWLTAALGAAEKRGAALFALGFSGRGAAVDVCLPFLDDPDAQVAKLAIDVVAAISDLPVDDDAFAVAPPADASADEEEPPPLEQDLDLDLSPDPVDELPLLNAAKVRAWWSERRKSYAPDRRYVRGQLLSPASLDAVLAEGPLRRLGPLATEIAFRGGGRVQLPALRLAYAKPTVPTDVVLHRPPAWR